METIPKMSNAEIMDRLHVALGQVLRVYGGPQWAAGLNQSQHARFIIWHRPARVRGQSVTVEWVVGDIHDEARQNGVYRTTLREIEEAPEPGWIEVAVKRLVDGLIREWRNASERSMGRSGAVLAGFPLRGAE